MSSESLRIQRQHPEYPDHGRDEDCKGCGARLRSWCTEPDPCIGFLPGVYNACCGHGDDDEAYITFESTLGKTTMTDHARLDGPHALTAMRAIRTALGDLDDPEWHGGHDDPDYRMT